MSTAVKFEEVRIKEVKVTDETITAYLVDPGNFCSSFLVMAIIKGDIQAAGKL